MSEKDALQRYIDRVGRLTGEKAPSAEALRTIALEVGVQPEQISAADVATETHLTRARTLKDADRAADALAELQVAAELAPWRTDLERELAEVHLRLACAGKRESLDHAERYARRVLQFHPDDREVAQWLNQIDLARRRPRVGRWFAGLGAILGLALAVGASGLGLYSAVREPVGVLAPPAEIAPIPSEFSVDRTPTEVPLAVTDHQGAEIPGLTDLLSTATRHRDGTFYYKMSGYLENVYTEDIAKLTGVLQLYNADGQPIGSDKVYLVGSLDAYLPPGAVAPLHANEPLPEVPHRAELRLDPPQYAPPQAATPLTLEGTLPVGVTLELEVRESARGRGQQDLLIQHTGTKPLDRLKLRMHTPRADGTVSSTDVLRFISVLDPAFLPDTRWSVLIESITPTPDSWVEVVEVRVDH